MEISSSDRENKGDSKWPKKRYIRSYISIKKQLEIFSKSVIKEKKRIFRFINKFSKRKFY